MGARGSHFFEQVLGSSHLVSLEIPVSLEMAEYPVSLELAASHHVSLGITIILFIQR